MTTISRTLAVLLALSIGLGALMALRWQQAERRAVETLEWAHAAIDSARKAARPGSPSRTLLPEEELERLHRVGGLADPAVALRESLAAHPELIPFPGVEGGRMVYGKDRIVLIPPSYAFAEFEDGHVGGYMLLHFDAPGNGIVLWKRLWWERD
jgi:hypothetical protein